MKTTCGRLSNYQIRATAANRDSTQSSVGQERSRKLQPRVTVRLQKAALSSASGLLRQLRELPFQVFLCGLKCSNDSRSDCVRVKVFSANLNHTGLFVMSRSE